MNTELSTTDRLSAPDGEDSARPPQRGSGLAWLATILALVSLTASGWLWWQDAGTRQAASSRFSADLNRQDQLLAHAESRMDALEAQLSALAAADPERRLGKLERDFDSIHKSSGSRQTFEDVTAARLKSLQADAENARARLSAAEARLAMMSARTVDGGAELDLAEVDYLLRLSQERLVLFADVKSADRALEIAGRHIASFDNPLYLGVQREIGEARQKLSESKPLDYQALDQALELLKLDLGKLAFRGEAAAPARSADSSGAGWWDRIRNAFSGLVTVRRSTGDDTDLPVLADQELVRQRAWLELEVARWAAARRDQEAYSAALNRFSNTLERWFEPPPESFLETLQGVQQQNVDPPLPDISAPWVSLKSIQGIGVSTTTRPEASNGNAGMPESPAPAAEETQEPGRATDTGGASE